MKVLLLLGIVLTGSSLVASLSLENLKGITVVETIGVNSHFVDPFANETAPSCAEIPSIGVQNGLTDPNARWELFLIYMDPAYNNQERESIIQALHSIKGAVTCLTIAYINSGGSPPVGEDYVHIVKGSNNGCSSAVGRTRRGRQNLNLQSPGCLSQGTIMHELIHALGFHHEQVRADRDDYVTINFGNIIPGTEHNFQKVSGSGWSNFGVPYNQRSIMHYGSHDFSRNNQPVIIPRNGQPVGSTGQLQQTDIQRLRNMYNC